MDSELQQLAKTDRNPIQETRYQELLKGSGVQFSLNNGRADVAGFGTGGNYATTDQFNQATGMAGSGTSGVSGVGMINTPTIDLTSIYNNLYKNSGISDLEKELSDKTTRFIDAQKFINDDPFLAEGNRVGRVQKLATDFDSRVANLKNDIATKKADVEMQLNLQTKQFDINSQAAQQSFQQFTSLLQAGALDNASGSDIANITKATGLSSSMIQSAVNASKAKNVQTQVIQYDDGVNQGFAVINPQTGEVIKQQVVSTSKTAVTSGGSGGGGGTGVLNETRQFELDKKQAPALAAQAAKSGKTLKDMISFYSQWLDPTTVYNIYNQNSIYGAAKEASTPAGKKLLASWGVKIK